jgi:hypothetical protein
MADTKPVASRSELTANAGERTIRSYEEALTATPEPPTPTQEEADAIKEGTYESPEVPPEGETAEAAAARKKREEERRQRREAKAASDQASYQTR